MVNITLILLLLHYIGLYIFKPKLDTLNCGIGGYIGNNFNKYKFNILGLYNDTRGGDSCGVFVGKDDNKSVYYGHDKTKLYKNFVESGGLKDVNLESPDFALLHCRKASVGGVSLATAQPVVIRDGLGKVVFSMIHNGTLVNYKELADKYHVPYNLNETDSQIFCKTVYKAGYDVLSEYDGAGAFIFWDSRDGKDTIKLFKGASLFYQNDKALYVERPLYCIREDNSFWFSSMKESLEFINEGESKIEDITTNILFTIRNGNVIAEDHIDRSDKKQSEKLQVNWEKNRELNAKNQKNNYNNDYNNYFDDYYCEGWSPRQYNNDIYGALTGKTEAITTPPKFINKIYYDYDGLYKHNRELCDGPIEATKFGYTGTVEPKKSMYYFVSGVLMMSYFDYLCATQFVAQGFILDIDYVAAYLAPYAYHPTCTIVAGVDNEDLSIEFYAYNETLRDIELFTGSFEPLFGFKKERYIVNLGGITWKYEYNNSTSFLLIPKEKEALDYQILSGQISKNELKKMIKRNLKTVYVGYERD